ncbi:MAG: MBL fold metallo-hydrolase [Nitrososphaeraceae archaeon]
MGFCFIWIDRYLFLYSIRCLWYPYGYHIANSRYKMDNIQGIILTHIHPDHIQAANEIFQRCIPG